jgi:hypothetical protein
MNLQNFQQLLSYQDSKKLSQIIFDFLWNLPIHHQKIDSIQIQELLKIIEHDILFQYQKKTGTEKYWYWFNQLSQLHQFHQKYIQYPSSYLFVKQNLFFLIEKEIFSYYEYYEKIQNSEADFHQKHFFLSPLGIYNIFSVNHFFSTFLDADILEHLLSLEKDFTQNKNCLNPIIQQGIHIIDQSLKNPLLFQEFILYWNTYQSFLIPQHENFENRSYSYVDLSKDFNFISSLYQQNKISQIMYDQYVSYKTNYYQSHNHDFHKSILSKKMTEFFFTHFEEFQKYSGLIPNATVWIFHARKFLSTQLFLNELNEKHLQYFSHQNKNIDFYEKFVSSIIFSQSFSSDIASEKMKKLFQKNLPLEILFSQKNSTSNLQSLDLYIRLLAQQMKSQDVISFYQKSKLEQILSSKETIQKSSKI